MAAEAPRLERKAALRSSQRPHLGLCCVMVAAAAAGRLRRLRLHQRWWRWWWQRCFPRFVAATCSCWLPLISQVPVVSDIVLVQELGGQQPTRPLLPSPSSIITVSSSSKQRWRVVLRHEPGK
jgi:hypothetical protein